ncbi:MAG: hypothetical protein KOO60_12735 [Gemmatimonadales bacterium]|nr:hypothetical protein [Gemmatimonadales bacterium]
MKTKKLYLILSLIPALVCGFSGCSESDDPENSNTITDPIPNPDLTETVHLNLSDYGALLAEVAPPVFVAEGAQKSLDDWTSGECPLLGKVFSDNEPMSIYYNIDALDGVVVMMEEALAQWEFELADEDSTTGEQEEGEVAEETVDNGGGSVVITPCTELLAVPVAYQDLLGETVDLDYTMVFESDQDPGMDLHFGFRQSEASETILAFHAYDYVEGEVLQSRDSFLFYAHRDLVTDAIEVKGLFCKLAAGEEVYDKWIYEFATEGDSEFTYRMAWYAASPEFVGSIIGSGDKDVEFALRYQQYDSPNFVTSDPEDPWGNLTQVFGPDYSDLGATLNANWEVATPETGMFNGDDMPTGLLTSPFPDPAD